LLVLNTIKHFLLQNISSVVHHAPCTLHLAPSTLLPFLFLDFIPPHLCVMQLIVHHYIFQCQGVLLWCTKILTEGLPLLFGAPFSMSARYLLHIMLLILPTNAREWIKKSNSHL